MSVPTPASELPEPDISFPALNRPVDVRVEGLSKRYGPFWALRDASFDIRAGEILGLIGPNGSGKTTLFRSVAGLAPATSGAVLHAGEAIAPKHRKHFLYFVPDGIRPWPDQTADWVLRFIAGLHGATVETRREIVESLGLASLLGARLRELSKGEHRRVMLAAGLLTPQPLLMLDEPFDGLDLRQTRDVMRVLTAHARSGRTLFLSIHQLGDAARICDRLVLLSDGRVAGEGTLDELRARANLAATQSLEDVFLALT
ncbi:MAG TPA: ABC transporter ATP-binding protein [Gemmatimonadaceae bacterium]|jgi:ABC-2 type transport system ATP-binding protein|nr:ABC transporter ATP-binding protein [Gemmatimonadaceae bacterium]